MRHRLLLLSLIGGLPLLDGQSAGGAVSGRHLLVGGLKGLEKYQIFVSVAVPPDFGITAKRLTEHTELRLRSVGVGILKSESSAILVPRLSIEIDGRGAMPDEWYAIKVVVRVEDLVKSISHPSAEYFFADVFQETRLIVARDARAREELGRTIDEMLTSFLNAHLEMNPVKR